MLWAVRYGCPIILELLHGAAGKCHCLFLLMWFWVMVWISGCWVVWCSWNWCLLAVESVPLAGFDAFPADFIIVFISNQRLLNPTHDRLRRGPKLLLLSLRWKLNLLNGNVGGVANPFGKADGWGWLVSEMLEKFGVTFYLAYADFALDRVDCLWICYAVATTWFWTLWNLWVLGLSRLGYCLRLVFDHFEGSWDVFAFLGQFSNIYMSTRWRGLLYFREFLYRITFNIEIKGPLNQWSHIIELHTGSPTPNIKTYLLWVTQLLHLFQLILQWLMGFRQLVQGAVILNRLKWLFGLYCCTLTVNQSIVKSIMVATFEIELLFVRKQIVIQRPQVLLQGQWCKFSFSYSVDRIGFLIFSVNFWIGDFLGGLKARFFWLL